MTRRDINAFISKYLDESGKPYEALTEFRKYNQELIDQDKDKIIAFFSKIYDFTYIMSFKDFEKSKDGETLYKLEHIYDLDEFEDLIGLLFASGILINDLTTRMNILQNNSESVKYLIRDFNELNNYYEKEYVTYLDKYLLPVHKFNVNKDVIKNQNKASKKTKSPSEYQKGSCYTNQELKDLLTFWFLKEPMAKSFVNFFISLLDTRLDTILNFAIMMKMADINGQATLIVNIIAHKHNTLLEEIENKYLAFSKETLEIFNQHKEKFLEMISIEMQEKNRHL